MFNAHYEKIDFKLPSRAWGARWMRILDTDQYPDGEKEFKSGEKVPVEARSMVLLKRLEVKRRPGS
jgi:isoamylase